jgi:hypothetical protein
MSKSSRRTKFGEVFDCNVTLEIQSDFIPQAKSQNRSTAAAVREAAWPAGFNSVFGNSAPGEDYKLRPFRIRQTGRNSDTSDFTEIELDASDSSDARDTVPSTASVRSFRFVMTLALTVIAVVALMAAPFIFAQAFFAEFQTQLCAMLKDLMDRMGNFQAMYALRETCRSH